MNLRKFTLLFTACLFACPFARSAEQDNWYIAWEASVPSSSGVAYHVDSNSTTGVGQIYVTSTSSDDVKVYDLNGSLDRTITIASNLLDPSDLVLDEEGTIYIVEYYAVTCLENDGTFKWRTGKNASESNRGDWGSGDGEFNYAHGITLGQDGNLYVADRRNYRVQVLDKNGSFIRKFGENGSAPGQLNNPLDIASFPDGRIVVGDYNYLHYFQPDGTFLKRENQGSNYVSVGPDGTMFSVRNLLNSEGNHIRSLSDFNINSRTCFTPEGDLVESYNSKLRLWKRAFRTKGLPERNVIAQPAIREVSQRAGTNIIDIDVEIIDSDDANVTIGVLAAIDGEFDNPTKWIIPQAWVDYSENKIGTPISTNVV
ncbi:NHL repeat-containing protein, partial [Opitutales bacterium]|nr:NHL repeat-containing protein [Opitutales bacterium]